MNADGSGLTRLTNNDLPDLHPSWRPDGAVIAFSAKPSAFSAANVFLISPNGSGETQLTHEFLGANAPAWSHDGQQLAYATTFMGIFVASANGSGATAVPNTLFITDFDFK
jgi:Tol biopolymer transport system component